MKKILPWIVLILGIAIIGVVVWGYVHHHVKPNDTPEKISGEEIVVGPIFTKDNYPKIDASTAIQPLVDAIKNELVESGEEFEVTYTNTHPAFTGVVDGTTDVAFMSYPSDEEIAYAREKGIDLNIVRATNSAFVFIVNVDNPVDGLTLEQIKDIYSGKITNWKEVGGEDAEIIPYQRPVNSGSQSGMLQLVMKETPLMDPPSMELTVGMGDLVDAIAQYDNSRYALGYSYYYYVNTMYKRDTIKILSVDGVPATIPTIQTAEYPIMTGGYLVYRKDANENTIKWVEAVTSDRCAKVIEDAGYVPAK